MILINLMIGCSSLILIFFSIHLFYTKSGNRYLNLLLGLWFFSRFCDNALFFLIDSGNIVHFPIFLKLFSPLSIMAPALSFLYLKGFIKDQSGITRRDWIHLLPGVLAVVEVLPWYFSPSIDWSTVAKEIVNSRAYLYHQRTGFLSFRTLFYAKNVLVLAYTLLMLSEMYRSGVFQNLKVKNRKSIWLIFFVVVVFFPQVGRFFFAQVLSKDIQLDFNSPWFYFANVLSFLSLIAMVGFLVYNPRMLYGFILVSNNKHVSNNKAEIDQKVEKEELPGTESEQKVFDEYKKEMIRYMDELKPYLQPDFRIGQMALDINIPVHHCSYVLNWIIHKNFRDWINEYRINYFIEQYQLKHNNMTIEALAAKSGFSNHATFYNAFKKEIGITPKAYFKLKGNIS